MKMFSLLNQPKLAGSEMFTLLQFLVVCDIYTVCQLHAQLSWSGIPSYNEATAVRKPTLVQVTVSRILHTDLLPLA